MSVTITEEQAESIVSHLNQAGLFVDLNAEPDRTTCRVGGGHEREFLGFKTIDSPIVVMFHVGMYVGAHAAEFGDALVDALCMPEHYRISAESVVYFPHVVLLDRAGV